jgi:hypothetical protein
MRTVTIEVGGLLPVLRAPGVHKRLTRLPDVEKAQINNVAGRPRRAGLSEPDQAGEATL